MLVLLGCSKSFTSSPGAGFSFLKFTVIQRPRQNDGDSDSDSDSDSGSNSMNCRRGVCTITSCKNNICQTVISTRGSVAQTLSAGHTSVPSMGVVPTPAPTSSTRVAANRSSSTSTSGTLSAHPSTISSISGLSTQSSSRPSNGALAGIAVAACEQLHPLLGYCILISPS